MKFSLLALLILPLIALGQVPAPVTTGPHVPHAPFNGNADVERHAPTPPAQSALDVQMQAIHKSMTEVLPPPVPITENAQGLLPQEEGAMRQLQQFIHTLLLTAHQEEVAGQAAAAARDVALAAALLKEMQGYMTAAAPKK